MESDRDVDETAQPDQWDEDQLLDEVGAAFSRLRRRTTQVNVDPAPSRKDLNRNLVLNIVDEGTGEMTVGGLAEQLGIDPSAASRAVSDCIGAGLLERRASQLDGRRTVLSITPEGHALRARFRHQQRAAFVHITSSWSDEDRLTFARLLVRYDRATARLTD
ncbi:MarR family winged helix-turn-helix transcriptional regulator [Cellulomonas sp. URHE0023]|uniref:MarR family winged helix-turn-helix transcriptional regulator n=1 Tax=Cellulomonas sp. URHE0023 TaxID=1380354 RepID=UPI000558BC26|nr:MarR family winged helix-turn-helix transcriptional regulator [Cellulomonas sp. URHE0023]